MRTRTTLFLALAMMLVAGTAFAVDTRLDIGKVLVGPPFNFVSLIESTTPEQSAAVDLTLLGIGSVQSGYIVYSDFPGGPPPGLDNTKWSEVVVIEAANHIPTNAIGDPATKVALVSDSSAAGEGASFGITDAQLAKLGNLSPPMPVPTVAQIQAALATGAAGYAIRRYEAHHHPSQTIPSLAWRPNLGSGGESIYYSGTSDYADVPGANPMTMMIASALLGGAGVFVMRRKGRRQSGLA